MKHQIVHIVKNSIAEELGIEKGDFLIRVDGEEISDVFDFRMLTADDYFVLSVEKRDGVLYEYEIEKDPEEELGIVFENDLMSAYKSCANKCIFCFIDQMPKGMRDTLYFKDDDSRLSFLQGNYITMTNMSEKDVERIIRYRMEPMNISVHTTEEKLRIEMLHNRFAGKVLSYLDRFYEEGILMNAQIVLCRGINDGMHLERTLSDLFRYLPVLQSVSVVPVGLTKYREGLFPLEPFTKEDACRVIETVEKWQKKAYKKHGNHFVHASDEFYILAEADFPAEETYDGYLQLENGVGMARSLFTDAADVISGEQRADAAAEISHIPGKAGSVCRKKMSSGQKPVISYKRPLLATGELAYPLISKVLEEVRTAFPDAETAKNAEIRAIHNDFFGEHVTVSGLVTGQDLIRQIKEFLNMCADASEGGAVPDLLVLPNVMFRAGEEVFLDDVTRAQVENALGIRTVILKGGAEALVHVVRGRLTEDDLDLSHGQYELKG